MSTYTSGQQCWWNRNQCYSYRVEIVRPNCRRDNVSPNMWFDYSVIRIVDAFGHTDYFTGQEVEVNNTELADYPLSD